MLHEKKQYLLYLTTKYQAKVKSFWAAARTKVILAIRGPKIFMATTRSKLSYIHSASIIQGDRLFQDPKV